MNILVLNDTSKEGSEVVSHLIANGHSVVGVGDTVKGQNLEDYLHIHVDLLKAAEDDLLYVYRQVVIKFDSNLDALIVVSTKSENTHNLRFVDYNTFTRLLGKDLYMKLRWINLYKQFFSTGTVIQYDNSRQLHSHALKESEVEVIADHISRVLYNSLAMLNDMRSFHILAEDSKALASLDIILDTIKY